MKKDLTAPSKPISTSAGWKWLILLWPYALVVLLAVLGHINLGQLVYDVPTLAHLPFLENRLAYAYVHIFTFVPVFLLSFDRKVHYYKSWLDLFPSILIMGAFFVVWDVYKTLAGVWGFNGYYTTGLNIVYLPWEELLFFVTVPFASIFIYECLNAYFPGDPLARWDKPITLGLIIGCFILGLLYISKAYSSTTFILTGGFMLYHWYYVPNTYRTRFYRAFLVILIPFLLVDGVLTGGFTKEPIVLYNPEEYMGIRILSVPFEDAVYGFLLLFGVCYWLEWLRKSH